MIPGTGVGHSSEGLNEETLGVPVIAIGIPTVISSLSFAKELGGGAARYGKQYFLSPKGINTIVKNGAKIIGGGINMAFGIFD